MEIRKDFKEFLESLNSHDVQYLIVGAFALAWHGRPRYSGDLDIYVNPAPANASRVVNALSDFGFGSLGLTQDDFSAIGQVVQLGVAPVRIDILTSISAVDWETASRGSVPGSYADIPVRYLGKAEFIANKKAIGRLKDLADIEGLEETEETRG